jgi:hypothetical protein
MYYVKGKEGMLMRRKLLAAVSIVALLAMESMTVFATETGTGGGSPASQSQGVQEEIAAQGTLSGDLTTGEVITRQQGYTTEQVTKATKEVDEVSKKTADEIIKETKTEIKADEATGTLTNVTSGKKFVKTEEGKAYQFKPEGSISNANVFDNVKETGLNTIRNDDRYVEKEVSLENAQKGIAVVERADSIAQNVNSQMLGAMMMDIEQSDSNDAPSSQDDDIEVRDPSAQMGQDSLYATAHFYNDGKEVEFLPTTVKEQGILAVQKSKYGFSPFVIIKFDKPVPGLTYDIDYTTSSAATESSTIAGATSPKTAEADPYKTAAAFALIAIAGAAICSRKITNK